MAGKGLSPLTTTIILLIVSILIGVLVMKWGESYVQQKVIVSDSPVVSNPTVLDDLNTRLASGEITQQQYEAMKQVLMAGGKP